MSMPKVSVLVPSLNVVKYIEQCMQSIVTQTLRNIEIICIDAGSTDGTMEIIERFANNDSRIHIIHSDKKSYGYQMNLGLAMATGDYIGIVETDDYAERNMFARLYTLAIKNDADIVMSNYFRYRTETNTNEEAYRHVGGLTRKGLLPPSEKNRAILTGPDIWANLYSRKMLKNFNIVFVESLGASYQDTAFSIKAIIAAQNIVVTQKHYYHYRTDNTNSSVHSTGKVFCVCNEMAAVENFVKNSAFDDRSLWEILWKKKYGTYNWNISRLAKEPALEFVNKISNEFAMVVPTGLFDAAIFDDCRESIELLTNNPKMFLLTRPFVDFAEMAKNEDEQTVLQAENCRLSHEVIALKEKNRQLLTSVTYKVGRAVLALPKKIKKIFN